MSAVAIERWELHSELAFVSREVRARALERLPERLPYAFLDFPPAAAVPEPSSQAEAHLARGVSAYVLRRMLQTARTGVLLVGALTAFALAADIFH
jgi:hypothetical protein